MAYDPAKLLSALAPLKSTSEPSFPPPFDPPTEVVSFGATEEDDPPAPAESAPEGYPTLEEEQDEDPYEGVEVEARSNTIRNLVQEMSALVGPDDLVRRDPSKVYVGDVFERREKRGRGQRLTVTWTNKAGDVAAYQSTRGTEVLIPAWKLLSYRFERVTAPL